MKLIAAISQNGVIGKEGKLPWNLPEDLKRFRKLTTDNVVIMGGNTFFNDLEGKPLPNRKNIVITSKVMDIDFSKIEAPIGSIYFCYTPKFAIEIANRIKEDKEVWVIGGERVYHSFLYEINPSPIQELYITHTNYIIRNGDAFLDIKWNEWNPENIEFKKNLSFVKYTRKENG